MNRNTNAHFASVPSVDIHRSVLDRSHSHKTSGNVGQLIPIYVDPDIMPGDTVSMDSSKVVRFQTLLTPMMDNIQCDVYWFFTPHRLVWDHWINFMGENDSSPWIPAVEYTVPQLVVPTISTTGTFDASGTILDYMGYPVGQNDTISTKVNALPTRAYAKVVNDWFISEAVNDPVNLYTGDNDQTAVETGNGYVDDCAVGGWPFVAAKYHDYFTSALPSPQKGSPVEITLSGLTSLPVITANKNTYNYLNSNAFTWNIPDNGSVHRRTVMTRIADSVSAYAPLISEDMGNVGIGDWTSFNSANSFNPQNGDNFAPSNLWSAVPNGLSFSVNDMRYAFALQKLLERDARGGTRYIEVIRSHFGVISPDARMQRSEYLGGNRFAITVDQVSNTAQTESDFLGDLGAFSVTSDVHSDFTHSFTEHGTLLGLMVVRYDHTYSQGLPKYFSRKSRFDYYWPVFANIGEQPIYKKELFFDGTQTTEPFGYNEAWSDYRYAPNKTSGEMRPYVANGLYSWTLADDYETTPSLSASWLKEDKTNVDRVLAVTSEVSNQFWADIYFNAKYTRPMPVFSIPGLIDHN